MTLNQALLLCGQIVSLGLFLSGVEFLRLSKRSSVHGLWSIEILNEEFHRSLPAPSFFRSWLASKGSLRQLALAEIIVAIAALISPSAGLFLFLFVIHFLLCLRFRGTFNGGSDQMFLQVLLVLIFGFSFYRFGSAKWALVYLAVQVLYSYFKAGWVKLRSKDWRAGRALSSFLGTSPYEDIRLSARNLLATGVQSKILAWGVIVFEMSVPLAALNTRVSYVVCAIALIFHLMNVRVFGLNRFFWAWLSAWPAVFFLSGLL